MARQPGDRKEKRGAKTGFSNTPNIVARPYPHNADKSQGFQVRYS